MANYTPDSLLAIFGPQNASAENRELDFLRNIADRKSGGTFRIKDYKNGGTAAHYLSEFGSGRLDPLIDYNLDVLNVTSSSVSSAAASFALRGTAGNGISYTTVQDISTFLNCAPNTALSSLVPYVEVEFEFEYRAGELGANKVRHPSLMRFLMGPSRNDTGSADTLLDDSRILSYTSTEKVNANYQLGYSGMEMFTAPMTLVNPNIPNRYVPVLNPYAPLASLTAFNVKVVNQKSGFSGFTSATMEITLHDKTRLLEISELVQPQYFGGTVAWITYGWRCPEDAQSTNNPFTKFVNSRMLTKQAFNVTNASFSFDVHSAKISLSLGTTGYREIRNFQLSQLKGIDLSGISLEDNAQGLNAFYTTREGTISTDKPTTLQKLNQEMQKTLAELTGQFNETQRNIFGQYMVIPGDDNMVVPTVEMLDKAKQNIDSIKSALQYDKTPPEIRAGVSKYLALMEEKYKKNTDGTYAFTKAIEIKATADCFSIFKEIFGYHNRSDINNAADNAPEDKWLPKKWKDINSASRASAVAGNLVNYDSTRNKQKFEKTAANAAFDKLKAAIVNSEGEQASIVAYDNKKKPLTSSDAKILANQGLTTKSTNKAAAAADAANKDAWISTILPNDVIDIGKRSSNSQESTDKYARAFVSFGYFFEQLVLKAARSVPGISEAQVFFGDFNDKSKAVWKENNDNGTPKQSRIMNIAEFPISVAVFLQMYRKKVVEKGSETLTLNDIVGLLTAQIEDPRGEAYGLKNLYLPWSKEKDNDLFANSESKKAGEILQADWKMPSIGTHVDTLSPCSTAVSDTDLLNLFNVSAKQVRDQSGRTSRIMRIKVFDKNYQKPAKQTLSTPQPVLQTVTPKEALSIRQNASDYVDAQSKIDALNANYAATALANTNAALASKGISLTPNKDGTYYLNFLTNKAVKDFFSQKIPTIVVGSEGSSIISCAVSSNQNAQITASQIKKSMQGVRAGQPLGASGPSGLPVNIMPVTLSMTTIGCPLFEYGQTFFVDFNTGTSVDNTYYIVEIEHQFSPGKFQTSLRFAYANAYDGYRNPRTFENTLNLLASVL